MHARYFKLCKSVSDYIPQVAPWYIYGAAQTEVREVLVDNVYFTRLGTVG
jgi:hypothetical protein